MKGNYVGFPETFGVRNLRLLRFKGKGRKLGKGNFCGLCRGKTLWLGSCPPQLEP